MDTGHIGTLKVCVDCMERAEDNPRHLTGQFLTANWDTETGDGFTEFSKTPCYLCNSPLAGNRFTYELWAD